MRSSACAFSARELCARQTSVVLRHRSLRDLVTPALHRRQSLTGVFPRVLRMRELTQPLRTLVSVELENGINRLTLHLRQILRIALRPRFHVEQTAVNRIQVRYYRTIHPRFDTVAEKRFFVPHQRPGLRVVRELLQLHRRCLTELPQDVGCDVMCGGHVAIKPLRSDSMPRRILEVLTLPSASRIARRLGRTPSLSRHDDRADRLLAEVRAADVAHGGDRACPSAALLYGPRVAHREGLRADRSAVHVGAAE